jgi:hypothetical protein
MTIFTRKRGISGFMECGWSLPKNFALVCMKSIGMCCILYLKKNSITLSIETNLFITAMLSVVETIGVLPPRPKRMNY